MKEQLECFIRTTIEDPIEEEIAAILDIFKLVSYEKGAFFKRNDELSKKLGFIVEGSTRHYFINKKGDEITGTISYKNDFVTDLVSVRTKEITPLSIKVLEQSLILVASIKDMQDLLKVNLTFNRLIREYMAEKTVNLVQSFRYFLTGTAKERYLFLLEKNPSLLDRIPLRFIASMIGITPTQLSRIRKQE